MCRFVAALLLPSVCLSSNPWIQNEFMSQLQTINRADLKSSNDGHMTDDELEDSLFAAKNSSRCNIFTWWKYWNTPHMNNRLVVEGWRRHSNGLCNEPILLDDSNVKRYIPDLPDEFFSLGVDMEKSDMIRYAAIYHHGGIYMDTDMLVQKDLDPVIDLLRDHELVSYTSAAPDVNSTCQSKFSSNFIAGRKGSVAFKTIWEKQKEVITNHCPSEGYDEHVACCFDDKDRVCHVPLAGLGERISHPVSDVPELNKLTYCMSGNDSFVPGGMEDVLFKKMKLDAALKRLEGNKDPMGRTAYHLFNSLSVMYEWGCDDLKAENDFMGALHRSSFATGRGKLAIPVDRSEETKLWHKRYPYFAEFCDASTNGDLPCKSS